MQSLCRDAIFFVELINTAACCCRFLLTGIERMALGTNLNVDFLLGRTGYKLITAVAGNFCLIIGRMDSLFHDFTSLLSLYFMNV